MESSYKKLIIWQKSDTLVHEIYKLTTKFPKDEIYGVTSQIRRAALSVVLNIIEGYARNNKKEFKNFLRISYASLVEVEYLLDFSFSQRYITSDNFEYVNSIREECGRTLWKFIQSQNN